MDGDAEDLGEAFLDAVFEGRSYVVDAGDGKIALHSAMAGDEGVVLDLADADVVAIEKLIELTRQGVQEEFDGEFQAAHFTNAGIRGSDVAAERLDVNVHISIAVA